MKAFEREDWTRTDEKIRTAPIVKAQKNTKSQKSIRRNNSIALGFDACIVRRLCDVGASKGEVS